MTVNECPCENTLSILGLKRKPSKKEVKKIWKKLQKYHPDHCPMTVDEIFNEECKKKYNDLTAFINRARDDYDDLVTTPTAQINACINCYKNQVKKYSEEEIKYSLLENELDVNGSRNTLETRLIDNVPYKVFELNVWQYNAQITLIDKYLKRVNVNKLTQILSSKDIDIDGDKKHLIKIITKKIDETELFKIIQDVEKEFKNYNSQLKKLSKEQLIIILKKNNLSTKGKESVLINRILDSLTAQDIKNSIEKASKQKEDALKILDKLIGRSKFNQNYLDMLKFWGLNKNHGIKVKEEITKAIYDYEISENEVEESLNNLLKLTSEEYENELLNELYALTGKNQHSETYSQQLNVLQLSNSDGEQVKNDLINLIKSHNIQKREIKDKLHELLEEKYKKFEKEKLEILYNFTGENEHTPEFIELLETNDLTISDGFEIKKEMENLIKTTMISIEDILPEFKKLVVLKGYGIYLADLNIYELNQLAIINNIEISDEADKQKEIFVTSQSIDIPTIKSNSDEIKLTKNKLKKLSKKQLKFILNNLNLDDSGVKRDLIYRLFSNVHYSKINNEIEELHNIIERLNKLTTPQLEDILAKYSISFSGDKKQRINEITKRIDVLDIKNDLESFINLDSQLNDISIAGIRYIADMHGIDKSQEQEIIIDEINNSVDLIVLKSDILKVISIEKTLRTLNQKQLQYLTKSDNPNIDEILENIDLKEVATLSKVIKRITKKLNSYNANQLNYILRKNGLPQNSAKKDQIDMILQHVLIPDIQENIRSIKQINKKINSLTDSQQKEILEKNGLKYDENGDNISQIKEIPLEKIEKYLNKRDENVN